MRSLFLLGIGLLLLDVGMVNSLARLEPALYVLDVGQGDAILMRTPQQHHILVDGGAGSVVLEELGAVMPLAFSDIDVMILTHPHRDHMEGLISVLQRFEVHTVVLSLPHYESEGYEAFLEAVVASGAEVVLADDDTDLQMGSVFLDVLYPFEPIQGGVMDNINNASSVIRVTWGETQILLTGDAEEEVERALLEADLELSAAILKAGHHGSRTSSGVDFLQEVNPQVMLISSGEGNGHGHPHAETLESAESLGIPVRRTDREGRIRILLDESAPYF